jgi:hypothetical protein
MGAVRTLKIKNLILVKVTAARFYFLSKIDRTAYELSIKSKRKIFILI